jgi:hypothetical protein
MQLQLGHLSNTGKSFPFPRTSYSSIPIPKLCEMIIKKLPLITCQKFSILLQESTVSTLEEFEQIIIVLDGIM